MAVNIGINIQRSPNRINQQLREAGVLGKYPKLLLDFKDEYYLTNGSSKTLANAVTHARSGNATMTDGYGPELVVNGGFDSDSDWTKNTGWSIANGVATSDGTTGYLYQANANIELNKMYVVTYTVTEYVSGSIRSGIGNLLAQDGGVTRSAKGTYTDFLKRSVDNDSQDFMGVYGINFVGSIDSVSVREMPVIKWAPHNLLTYSEQFDNAAWTKNLSTVTANSIEAPDGTTTADTLTATGTNGEARQSATTSAADYTFAVWIKRKTGSGDVRIGNFTTGTLVVAVTSEWQLFTNTATLTAASHNFTVRCSTSGDEVYVWGAHLYRSDLGGMVDNPERGDSYVPTTSSAKYLPRIGHHVYTGSSAWANEGLLAESEARTNLLTYSNDFSQWNTSNSPTVTDDNATSPDGTTNATALLANGTGGFQQITLNPTLADNTDYNVSVYYKAAEGDSGVRLALTGKDGTTRHFNALSDGSISTISGATSVVLQEIGNGWYRLSGVIDSASGAATPSVRIYMTDSSGGVNTLVDGDGIYIYGAQLEEASTPSSLIPTSGSSVTRASETFTIPSANLPWPEPVYIGSELVTNGTFDSDLSGWDDDSTGSGTATVSSGQVSLTRADSSNRGGISQSHTLVSGKIYLLSFELVSGAVQAKYKGGSGSLSQYFNGENWNQLTTSGVYQTRFVATGTDGDIAFLAINNGVTAVIDNISVREIDPLSVSIAMDGRMTYADIDAFDKPKMFRWYDSATDRIFHSLDTNNGTGEPKFVQEANNVFDAVQGDGSEYAPDVLVPFNMASRHGSTFLNGAVDGVALTADTTPTALPDLSANDLSLAYDYMGTISVFRVWDRDIGDTGLVEATSPSLEPSLSLTFEGVGTNSFVVNDWS